LQQIIATPPILPRYPAQRNPPSLDICDSNSSEEATVKVTTIRTRHAAQQPHPPQTKIPTVRKDVSHKLSVLRGEIPRDRQFRDGERKAGKVFPAHICRQSVANLPLQIAEMGAYVKLLEYDNIDGMILLSELSRRRIRSIQKLIRVGRNEVVVVLRVDKEKGRLKYARLQLLFMLI